MIRATSQKENFLTLYTNDRHVAASDAPAAKGGGDLDFTPMDLLEASLACCMNITLRVYAQNHGMELSGAEVTVTRRPEGEGNTFVCAVTFRDALPPEQKKRLLAALKGCPIHDILTKPMRFDFTEQA